jgi:hypothetical protein
MELIPFLIQKGINYPRTSDDRTDTLMIILHIMQRFIQMIFEGINTVWICNYYIIIELEIELSNKATVAAGILLIAIGIEQIIYS